MTYLSEFQDYFYDLVLKKSLNITLRSVNCYIELSNNGQEMSILTTICQNNPHLKELILRQREYLKAQNFQIDIRNQQIVIARKYDFTQMSPDIFALKLTLFHSEVLRCRNEIDDLDEEKVLVPR